MCECSNGYECPHYCWHCSAAHEDGCEVWCHIRPFEEEEETMTEFKPGDRVNVSDGEMTIAYGPFDTPIERGVYLVSDDAGYHVVVAENQISPIPPADPRVDVVAKALYNSVCGLEPDTDTWWDNDSEHIRENNRGHARAILAALDAHSGQTNTPPAPRRVRDSDGDVWEINDDGTWDCSDYGWARDLPLHRLNSEYGPLTDV